MAHENRAHTGDRKTPLSKKGQKQEVGMQRRKSQRAERAAGCVWALGKKPEISQEAPLYARRIPRSRRETEIGACRLLEPRSADGSCGRGRRRAPRTSAGRRHTTPRQATSWRRDPCERYRLLVPGEGKRRVSNLQRQSRLVYCAPRR